MSTLQEIAEGLPRLVIRANGKAQQPNPGKINHGPDPLGRKFWVTQPGKEPWPARCLLKAKGIQNR